MRPEQDAYGEILKAIHTGEDPSAGEIIERDDGYIEYTGSAKTYFKEFGEWSEQTKKAIQYSKGSILDIGAGAGRHSLYLQKEGYEVKAIDVSPKAIQVCSDRGIQDTQVAGLSDIPDLECRLDTCVMLGNNLGLLGTSPIDNLNMLSENISEGGYLIAQTREATATQNPNHLQYHEYNKTRGRRPGCIRMRIRYKQYKTPFYDYLYIDKENLKSVIDKTSWSINEIITDADDPTYTIVLENANQ